MALTAHIPYCSDQGYCVVPADKRFLLLFTFLRRNANKKVMRREGRQAAVTHASHWTGLPVCFGGSQMRQQYGRRTLCAGLEAAASYIPFTGTTPPRHSPCCRSWCFCPAAMRSSSILTF